MKEFFKRVGTFLLGALSTLAVLLSLYPRVTMTTSFDSKDPLSSSFLISNDGYLPAYSVTVYCLVGSVTVKPAAPDTDETGTLGSTIQPMFIPVATLMPGSKELVPFSDCITVKAGGSLASAHVGLRVSYRPLLWPTQRTFSQEFKAKDDGNGGYMWYSVPYPQ